MMKQRILAATLILGLISPLACQTVARSKKPLLASLRTDSTEIGVEFRGNAYVADIGFVYVNETKGPVSQAGCGGPRWPDLEKRVNDRWVPVYYPISLACRTEPDFSLESGATWRGVLGFMAFEPGHNIEPELLVDSIDGVYRLRLDLTEGREAGAKGARRVEGTSNLFRMTLRSGAAHAH